MIRRIEVGGRTIEVCKVANKMGKNKKRGTYHAHNKKREETEDKHAYLKKLIYSLLVSKQRFEAEFLKLKLKHKEFQKFLRKAKGD